jgi:hypothetical protein
MVAVMLFFLCCLSRVVDLRSWMFCFVLFDRGLVLTGNHVNNLH